MMPLDGRSGACNTDRPSIVLLYHIGVGYVDNDFITAAEVERLIRDTYVGTLDASFTAKQWSMD